MLSYIYINQVFIKKKNSQGTSLVKITNNPHISHPDDNFQISSYWKYE